MQARHADEAFFFCTKCCMSKICFADKTCTSAIFGVLKKCKNVICAIHRFCFEHFWFGACFADCIFWLDTCFVFCIFSLSQVLMWAFLVVLSTAISVYNIFWLSDLLLTQFLWNARSHMWNLVLLINYNNIMKHIEAPHRNEGIVDQQTWQTKYAEHAGPTALSCLNHPNREWACVP